MVKKDLHEKNDESNLQGRVEQPNEKCRKKEEVKNGA